MIQSMIIKINDNTITIINKWLLNTIKLIITMFQLFLIMDLIIDDGSYWWLPTGAESLDFFQVGPLRMTIKIRTSWQS